MLSLSLDCAMHFWPNEKRNYLSRILGQKLTRLNNGHGLTKMDRLHWKGFDPAKYVELVNKRREASGGLLMKSIEECDDQDIARTP